MSTDVAPLIEEPRSSRAQVAVGKASQLLLYFLCVAPIALFPLGLAYKLYVYFLP